MKLTSETITVLKNFATINSNIEFKKGKVLSTISSTKTVLAKAKLKEDIPEDFCLHDLNQFLSVISGVDNLEMEFDDLNVTFKSGKVKTKYRKAMKKDLVLPPEKDLNFPSVDGSFTLDEEDMKALLKNAALLECENIVFESDGEKISAVTCSLDAQGNPISHTSTIDVGTSNGIVFKAVFLRDNFKMLPNKYNVQLSSKGLASFKTDDESIQYWIAIEVKQSSFGG
jgi:hypothetical protein